MIDPLAEARAVVRLAHERANPWPWYPPPKEREVVIIDEAYINEKTNAGYARVLEIAGYCEWDQSAEAIKDVTVGLIATDGKIPVTPEVVAAVVASIERHGEPSQK